MGIRALSTAAAALGVALAVMPAGTASAHGYLSGPASRQAQCAAGTVSCGPVSYEPQSVEGPKGQRNCSAGLANFKELDDDGKPWTVHNVGGTVDFTWTLTALHRTASYEYYIGDQRVGFVDEGNQIPDSKTQTHKIDLSGFSGKQKLLAIWNIGDTVNAFYSCVDLNIGGGSAPTTGPTTTAPAPTTGAPAPTTTPEPTHSHPTTTAPPSTPVTTQPNPAGKVWEPHATFAIGDEVIYQGKKYRCLQAHTAHDPNWTPANTPALWQPI
ncbi:lytic polysaccharide monooxygenase [Nocardia goodfellowii]|uniref:Chitin-binding protein n=1 Tax=Nocardia goodfellowii TaxID=882446 RepID=A0ABS4Q8G2_9NOCA|nr:lytic polysaccharide monooxygenase [Nocardia goodfellowii]MBP2187979.1 chitin-binding protein [Nocardia goodfellowii]